MNIQYFKYNSIITFLFLCISCDLFNFSPHEVPFISENEKNLNTKNIGKISEINIANTDSFCFAVIADTHTEYSILEDAVRQINKDENILFVIHLGDLTDGGQYNEFHWTNDKMSKLIIPYIMTIGNHDYLSNGKLIYDEMYNSSSFTFAFNKTKFVCFDNVIWENNNTYPDFYWLNNNLSDYKFYNHVFVFSHIPPFSDQFDEYCESAFNNILASNNVKLSLHGHVHCYTFEQHYNSNTWYFTADDIKGRSYYKISVTDSAFNVQSVPF